MAGQFKPICFFVMMALPAFIVCGLTAFYIHRAEHGHTAEERSAYEMGKNAGEQAAAGSQMPSLAEMNEWLNESLRRNHKKNQPMAWKTAFENGYENAFKQTHPDH